MVFVPLPWRRNSATALPDTGVCHHFCLHCCVSSLGGSAWLSGTCLTAPYSTLTGSTCDATALEELQSFSVIPGLTGTVVTWVEFGVPGVHAFLPVPAVPAITGPAFIFLLPILLCACNMLSPPGTVFCSSKTHF